MTAATALFFYLGTKPIDNVTVKSNGDPNFLPILFTISPLVVHYRPFGGGQGAFEITAVLVGGFRAGKMDGTVPNGGFPCRRVIERVLVHRRLVELG